MKKELLTFVISAILPLELSASIAPAPLLRQDSSSPPPEMVPIQPLIPESFKQQSSSADADFYGQSTFVGNPYESRLSMAKDKKSLLKVESKTSIDDSVSESTKCRLPEKKCDYQKIAEEYIRKIKALYKKCNYENIINLLIQSPFFSDSFTSEIMLWRLPETMQISLYVVFAESLNQLGLFRECKKVLMSSLFVNCKRRMRKEDIETKIQTLDNQILKLKRRFIKQSNDYEKEIWFVVTSRTASKFVGSFTIQMRDPSHDLQNFREKLERLEFEKNLLRMQAALEVALSSMREINTTSSTPTIAWSPNQNSFASKSSSSAKSMNLSLSLEEHSSNDISAPEGRKLFPD